jgi:hypothetical protein
MPEEHFEELLIEMETRLNNRLNLIETKLGTLEHMQMTDQPFALTYRLDSIDEKLARLTSRPRAPNEVFVALSVWLPVSVIVGAIVLVNVWFQLSKPNIVAIVVPLVGVCVVFLIARTVGRKLLGKPMSNVKAGLIAHAVGLSAVAAMFAQMVLR